MQNLQSNLPFRHLLGGNLERLLPEFLVFRISRRARCLLRFWGVGVIFREDGSFKNNARVVEVSVVRGLLLNNF